MTAFRGQFRRQGGHSVPGELDVSESGEIELRIWGATDKSPDVAKGPTLFEGALSESPETHARIVTLIGCLQTGQSWGVGGSTERWFVPRAVFGRDTFDPESRLQTAEFSFASLSEFLDVAPVAPAPKPSRHTLFQISQDGWRIAFGIFTTIRASRDDYSIHQDSFLSASIDDALTVDELLRITQPVFELLLSVAAGAHARVLRTSVQAPNSEHRFYIRTSRSRLPSTANSISPLFLLSEHSDPAQLLRSVRNLCTRNEDFTAHFLNSLRSPSRQVDERLRNNLNCLSLLLHKPSETAGSEQVDNDDLSPPASVVGFPQRLQSVLEQSGAALGIPDSTQFLGDVKCAFRWVNYHQGDPMSGKQLFNINQRIVKTTYFVLLRILGLPPEFALERIAKLWPVAV